jgi:hypothetical protein
LSLYATLPDIESHLLNWAGKLTSVIPAIWEVEIRRLRPAWAKSSQDFISTNKAGTLVHACRSSYIGGENKRIKDQGQPYLKNN